MTAPWPVAVGDGTILLWDMSPYATPAPADAPEAGEEEPAASILEPAAPNPFNITTRIAYRIATPGPVRLEVVNALGQSLHTLVNEVQAPGSYQVYWNARNQRGSPVAAGVYFTRLSHSGGVQVRRLLYLR